MIEQHFPEILENIFTTSNEPDAILSALLPALGEVLQCDRCFIYLRNPDNKLGKVPFCWRRSPEYPDVTTTEWEKEPESLPTEDPLFAAALRTEASIFVEDVET
ncbi:MAG TPA: GAF domain-containing protein, partial [Coleofasciculaceae cyanobacterium]